MHVRKRIEFLSPNICHHYVEWRKCIMKSFMICTIRQVAHVARMGERKNAYRLLVGKPEGRRPLGRPKRRWLDYIRMNLAEVGCGDVDWIGLAQDRDRWRAHVNSVLILRVPYNAGKLSSVLTTGDLSVVLSSMELVG
jgi:hypothetical protein